LKTRAGLHKLSDGRIAGGFRRGETGSSSGPLVVIFVDELEAAELQVRAAGGVITKEPLFVSGRIAFSFPRYRRWK